MDPAMQNQFFSAYVIFFTFGEENSSRETILPSQVYSLIIIVFLLLFCSQKISRLHNGAKKGVLF